MKISVVIPSYNCEHWIQRTLESVAVQTYPAHEIIVVDDGSTDDTISKIQESGVAVRLIVAENHNSAIARNIGVREASGDWIALLDADDSWEPFHLEEFSRLAGGEPQAIGFMANASYYRMDESEEQDVSRWEWAREPRLLKGDDFVDWYTRSSFFCHCTVVVLKSRFLEIGGYNEEYVYSHDVEMFLRLVCGHPWIYSPRSTARILMRQSGNLTSNRIECGFYLFRAFSDNRLKYGGELSERVIRRQAKILIGQVVREGSIGQIKDCYSLVRGDLGCLDRMKCVCVGFFSVARRLFLRAMNGPARTSQSADSGS